MVTKKRISKDGNPIEDVLASGVSQSQLAAEWGYDSTSSIGLLRSYSHIPPWLKAERMALTFGWTGGGGEVIQFWGEKVQAREKAAAS